MYFLLVLDENLDCREFLYYFVTMLIQDHRHLHTKFMKISNRNQYHKPSQVQLSVSESPSIKFCDLIYLTYFTLDSAGFSCCSSSSFFFFGSTSSSFFFSTSTGAASSTGAAAAAAAVGLTSSTGAAATFGLTSSTGAAAAAAFGLTSSV